jgi:hypothetical protein
LTHVGTKAALPRAFTEVEIFTLFNVITERHHIRQNDTITNMTYWLFQRAPFCRKSWRRKTGNERKKSLVAEL